MLVTRVLEGLITKKSKLACPYFWTENDKDYMKSGQPIIPCLINTGSYFLPVNKLCADWLFVSGYISRSSAHVTVRLIPADLWNITHLPVILSLPSYQSKKATFYQIHFAFSFQAWHDMNHRHGEHQPISMNQWILYGNFLQNNFSEMEPLSFGFWSLQRKRNNHIILLYINL